MTFYTQTNDPYIMKRREFLSMTGMIAAAGVASPVLTSCCDSSKGTVNTKNITKKYQTDVPH